MKKSISIVLCIILIFACFPVTANAAGVKLSPQNLTVNGRPVECEKYNIDGSNYFKLRDIAYLLNGTSNQFEVGYDTETRTITVTSGLPYTPNGEELVIGMDRSSTAKPSTQSLIINGVLNSELSAYNLAGNNFFKLRDLGNALGFIVDYDKASNTAIILSFGTTTPTPGPTVLTELNAEQVFEKCSPAVAFVAVYDKKGTMTARGSGFFLESDGVLVTNYHVIDGCYYATIETSDTHKTYNVLGVYDYNTEQDWAVLKVDGAGFSTLEIGNSDTIIGGAKVFAIGSPKGLQNTISEGVISNPSRQFGDINYIQTDAAISHGSSGGALINKYGQVIGITSAGYDDAQNLNFALPLSYVIYSTNKAYSLLEQIANENKTVVEDPLGTLKTFLMLYGKSSYYSGSTTYQLEYTGNDGVTYTLSYTDSTQYTYIEESYSTVFADVDTILYLDGNGANEIAETAVFWYTESGNTLPIKYARGYGNVFRDRIAIDGDFEFYYWDATSDLPQATAEFQCYKSLLNIIYMADSLFAFFGIPLTMEDFGYVF